MGRHRYRLPFWRGAYRQADGELEWSAEAELDDWEAREEAEREDREAEEEEQSPTTGSSTPTSRDAAGGE